MKTRQLGNTKLRVTEIGFGGALIGNLYSEYTTEETKTVICEAFNNGIRYFDTAPEYGHGLSERRLGDVLRHLKREDFVLSTKVGELLFVKQDQLPNENKFINKLPFHLRYDYTYDGIMRAFEDSLQRLGLQKIDFLLVHDLDPVIHDEKNFPQHFRDYIAGGYRALDELRQSGEIQAIGLGVKKWEICARALQYGHYDCFMLQGNYTLLDQNIADHFFETCLKKNISILIAAPFASGILATGAIDGARYNYRIANDDVRERVRLIEKICKAFNISIKAAALQFPLKHPAIASVVVGSATVSELKENILHSQIDIPCALWETLEDEFLAYTN